MQTVSTHKEILDNLETLAHYRMSNNPTEDEFYRELILRGTCFVIYERNGDVLWGPSRFVGYRCNSMTSHEANDSKDGKVTNPAISTALGYPPNVNAVWEERYRQHCRELGLNPREKGSWGVDRKYWLVR